jgi:glycosyltransferase involved in cell wall biosynthesis
MKGTLNILQYIETSGPGGAETVLVNIARSMDRSRFNPQVVLHKSRWLHQQLLAADIPTCIIPGQGSWDLSFLRKLIRACRELEIDVIHAHLFGASLYACLAGVILRVPVIATFHNELYLPGRAERFLPLKNFLIRRLAAKIVLVADFMKIDYIKKGHYPLSKMVTIYNGINFPGRLPSVEAAALRKELGLEATDLIVGHVANFRTPKGHRYLVEAAADVCRRIPQAKFLLIGEFGDGSIKSEVETLMAKYHIEDKIKLLGFRSDVHKLLDTMDVFILPSVSEGHPLSVVEAMAAAKPVVATRVGGLEEIIEDGRTGYLVAPKDPISLAERMVTLLKDQNHRREMGQAAFKEATGRFSLEAMMKSYEELYREVVSGS